MTAIRDLAERWESPTATEVSVAGSLAQAETALRQVMAEAEALRRRADVALEALRAAQGETVRLAIAAAQAGTDLTVTVDEAARRLGIGEQAVRRLLDVYPECRREFGRSVRVYWPALTALLARQRVFDGDESRPFPRDIAKRRRSKQAAETNEGRTEAVRER